MTLKHILVYVDNDESCRRQLGYAADLATAFDARITGLYARRLLQIPAYAAAHIPAPVISEYDQLSDEMMEATKAEFQRRMDAQGLSSEWQVIQGFLPDAIAARARCTDLVVLPQTGSETADFNESYSTDSTLLKVGAPVLIVPYAGQFEAPAKHAVVAWNSSREAGRAAREALPLLHKAERVTVLSIASAEQQQLEGAELGAYLAHHGLDVDVKSIPAGGCSTDDALLSFVADNAGDLLVMGGYGRSRFMETILGGVTRGVLAHMTVPVLMAH